MYGLEGVEWVDRLPALLEECERRRSVTINAAFSALSYSYAAPATRADGTPVVVKARFPNSEFRNEADALLLYDGRGAVRLLEADMDWGVLVLERLEPGTMLYTIQDDEQATSIAASVMKQLWRPVPANHSFPSVAEWAQGLGALRESFGGGTGPLPEKLVEEAERLFDELLSSTTEPVVLHGDLHHFNILKASRQPVGDAQNELWLAIDPQGVVGDAAYDTASWLRNPTPDLMTWPNLKQVLARRVDQLAEELGFDKERVRAWGIAHCVLSAWWDIEGHGRGWEPAQTVAELLSAIKS